MSGHPSAKTRLQRTIKSPVAAGHKAFTDRANKRPAAFGLSSAEQLRLNNNRPRPTDSRTLIGIRSSSGKRLMLSL